MAEVRVGGGGLGLSCGRSDVKITVLGLTACALVLM